MYIFAQDRIEKLQWTSMNEQRFSGASPQTPDWTENPCLYILFAEQSPSTQEENTTFF